MTDKYIYSINGIISRTVTSNDLIVAIKNYDGTDFSSSAPLVHKIGDTPRTLTGALSVTVTHGTSIFGAGATEFAATEIDYFTYLGWRAASSTIFILISRIPYATTYADFSATSTNEKYGAYSGSAPASTDQVVNIGRFNATNSGTASFNWSVPATSVVINYPTYNTRRLTFVPTHTRQTTPYTNLPANLASYYQVKDRQLTVYSRFQQNATPGGTGRGRFSIPFAQQIAFAPGNGFNETVPYGLCVFLENIGTQAVGYLKYDGTVDVIASNIYDLNFDYFFI